MGRFGRLRPNYDPKALFDLIARAVGIIDGEIEFGHPDDEQTPGAGSRAGSAAGSHPGTLMNIGGSWVELLVTALDTAVTCYHNLNVTVAVAGEPNVRWLLMGFRHDGNTVATGIETVSCNFQDGDTITTDSIQLRFYAGPLRVVDADHPLRVSLFFTRAVRWQ